jgi:hypothetical protein
MDFKTFCFYTLAVLAIGAFVLALGYGWTQP